MELIDIIPEFNLYEEFWKIYTNSANIPPQYIAEEAVVDAVSSPMVRRYTGKFTAPCWAAA